MRLASILIAILILPASAAAAAPSVSPDDLACGLPHQITADLGERLARRPHLAAATAGSKLTRDAFGTFPNERFTANFIVKWGPNGSFTDAQLDRMLAGFEEGWTYLIDGLAHTQPGGTETYKLNVYIGNTGGSSPDIGFAGGYAYIDTDGYPYIVISPSLMDYYLDPDYAIYGDSTMVHEFFHTVQFGTGAYDLGSNYDAYFWWEATAEWASAVVQPDSPANYNFVGAYVMMPNLPMHYVDYPDEGTLIELHHYGAGIFAQYLTEHAADEMVVRDSWENALAGDDPLEHVDGLLDAHGTSLNAVFADYAARNVVWDYAQGAVFAQNTSYYTSAYPGQDDRIAAEIPGVGTGGFVNIPYDLAPERYGYAVLRMTKPYEGDLTVTLEVDPGNESALSAAAIRNVLNFQEYTAFTPVKDTPERFEMTFTEVTPSETIYVVVVNHPQSLLSPRLPFRYQAVIQAANPGDGDPRGCACSMSRPAPARGMTLSFLAVAALGLAVLRRRRAV